MSYNKENIIGSEKPYKVLRLVSVKEDSYGRAISHELESDYTVVSEILSNLERLDIIEVAKRTRAKHFKINGEGLFDIFRELWSKRLNDNAYPEDIEVAIATEEGIKMIDPGHVYGIRSEEKFREEMPTFLEAYFKSYAEDVTESSIQKFLTDDFWDLAKELDIKSGSVSSESTPQWLYDWIERVGIKMRESREIPFKDIAKSTDERFDKKSEF